MSDAPTSEESASETRADPPSSVDVKDSGLSTPIEESATPADADRTTRNNETTGPPADVSMQGQHDSGDEPQPVLWLTPRDRLFVAVMVFITLLLMFAHWVRLSGWGLQEVEIERHLQRGFEYKLEINTATWVEWVQLEGIGETLARRIVDDRHQHGPFVDIDDVQRVKGIGPKKLNAIRMWLTVEPCSAWSCHQAKAHRR